MINPEKEKTRANLSVFLVCLVISIFIWFLIVLGKESFTSLDYPVEFINPPADMVLVNKPDSILTFRISSGGFELFTLRYLSRRKPVQIDLASMTLEENKGFFSGEFNTSRLIADVNDHYKFSEELISISPHTIKFRFEPLAGKMVPVVSGLVLEFQKQFRLSDSVVFNPAEVKVVGPRNLIDQIESVSTLEELVSSIEGEVSSTVELERPFANLVLLPSEVEYSLQAERYTESSIELLVHAADEKTLIKTFPEKIKVTYLVSLSNFKRVDPELFAAVVRIPAQSVEKTKAMVEILRMPDFVEITKIEPAEVDFLVLKK